MTKFAPARDDGLKPYLVRRYEWGRATTSVVYAKDARDAEYQIKGRMRYVSAHARRARIEDMPA